MFLNTENLNEGSCQEKCTVIKKRQLYEGKNPKSQNADRSSVKREMHVNSNWQKLRK